MPRSLWDRFAPISGVTFCETEMMASVRSRSAPTVSRLVPEAEEEEVVVRWALHCRRLSPQWTQVAGFHFYFADPGVVLLVINNSVLLVPLPIALGLNFGDQGRCVSTKWGKCVNFQLDLAPLVRTDSVCLLADRIRSGGLNGVTERSADWTTVGRQLFLVGVQSRLIAEM
ncbi:unnamed protein product [Mesocestoides corti]|uniref:DUF4283 domain-containing protein n=1 Tax=Mesocestoides corti TaxID=53468 RepID=A0A0R3UGN2_MESCO|nr:unnamed protein product [Mesocestoides corti]